MKDPVGGHSQHQGLDSHRLRQLRRFWISQLNGLPPLDWWGDRPPSTGGSCSSHSIPLAIEPQPFARFAAQCVAAEVNLQLGVLALMAVMLHRTTRQSDLAIGLPISSPSPRAPEGPIAPAGHTLPIRIRFIPGQTFRQLLAQVKATWLAVADHSDLSFTQIMQLLPPGGEATMSCPVRVVVALKDGQRRRFRDGDSALSGFDLAICCQRTERGGCSAELTYSTALFEAHRMHQMAQRWSTLLHSVLEASDAPIASLCLLPDLERRLIERWQQGPRSVSSLGVHHRFEHQANATPEAVALMCQDESISYGDLDSRANELAQHLLALGLRPGGIVAVGLERSSALVVALLAILKAGGAYLALDPSWPLLRQRQLLHEVGCRLLLHPDGTDVLNPPPQAVAPATAPPLAYVATTSGSTGTPKAVAVGHPGILRLVDPVNGFLLAAGAKVLQLAPAAFDAATFEIWGPLLNGGTLVIPPPGQLSLAEVARELRLHGITTLWLTAGLFEAMVNAELPALAGVRQVLAGGDVLAVDSVRRLLAAFPPGHELINGYGPTEATTFTCCHRLLAGDPAPQTAVPIGRPIANTTVRVLDPAGHLCPIGVPGELHIGGEGLALGYLHNPGRTAAAFIADHLSKDPSARLYKSGDLVSWTSNGNLTFHGRIDQQIKLRGFRIEPAEIEATLLAHPAIAQAVVVLRRDDPSNPRLVAYWVPKVRGTAAENPRGFLAERLPPVMVPSAFVALPGLPLTRNGKVDRQALPAPSWFSRPGPRVDPATERERQLRALWIHILGHGDFDCADNFFLVGGHSLAAMRLAVEVEPLGGQELSVATIFRHPSIREQAAWLDGRPCATAHDNLVILQPDGPRLPLYVIHGWGGTLGGFVHLARALAPDRPVWGLQNDDDPPRGPRISVAALAASYAEQILARHGDGPIHLLGFSAGGWYAYAVAAALVERGARIGLLALLDTDATARIHRRLGVVLLVRQLLPRLTTHVRALIAIPPGQGRRSFVHGRLWALKHHLKGHLGGVAPGLEPLTALDGSPLPSPVAADPFVRLLEESYRPPRLPVRVDLFTPPAQIPLQRHLWRFYGRAGVRVHPLFQQHFDFLHPELMPQLAAALEEALAEADGTT